MTKRVYRTMEEFERRFFPKTYAEKTREASEQEQKGTGLVDVLLNGLRRDLGLPYKQRCL